MTLSLGMIKYKSICFVLLTFYLPPKKMKAAHLEKYSAPLLK